MDTETIFVERKTHREDWTGEKSVKARFSLKEKKVNDFLAGRITVESIFEKMRKDGKKSEKEIADLEQLAREIQYRVITRKFVPVTRSFYNRTAFQLPGDARVRISLDTELTMIREDNMDGRNRAGKNWRRMDIGIDYPFSQLPPEDVERFPYAVLEVKLQTTEGNEPPTWVRELISSHLVEAVPKFSKFIHGTATLFPTRINLLPYWMPQMDVDIRKRVSRGFGIQRPGHSVSYSTSDDLLEDDSDDDENHEGDHDDASANNHRPQDDTDAESDPNIRRLREARDAMEEYDLARGLDEPPTTGNALDIEERIANAPITNTDDYPLYDSNDEDYDVDTPTQTRSWFWPRKTLEHHLAVVRDFLRRGLKAIAPVPLPTQIPPSTKDNVLGGNAEAKRFKAPKGKRIHVPVRVEPKVYFAAERTFLSWLEFGIYLGTIAAALLNFGDDVSFYSAWAFTIVACAALLYSAGLYLWRVRMIRLRRAARYHDAIGPSVLCAGLLVSVIVNFALVFGLGGKREVRV